MNNVFVGKGKREGKGVGGVDVLGAWLRGL